MPEDERLLHGTHWPLNVRPGSNTYHIHSCFINLSDSSGHTLLQMGENVLYRVPIRRELEY